ncbi:hypothetical protein AGMMS50262_18120 [Bacteroidia bacterium]|nr:hypothetical protein AGMMS50262_18120 [Bacteroidia bacterium]
MRYLIRISLVLCVSFLFIGAGTKEIKLTEGIQPGNLAPEIHLQGVDLKGEGYVLLQFWAAYDPQSRVENIQMSRTISQAQKENLRMISISLDENPAVFQGVVKTDPLNVTTQFNEPDGKKSAVFKNYHLKAGFTNWLIDSNGMIISKNLTPQEVIEKVKSDNT